jgi:hypothetical protein
MKKVLVLIFAVLLVFAACDSKQTGDDSDSNTADFISEPLFGRHTGSYTYAVMAPLHVNNWGDFEWRLGVAKSMGVEAVSVDVWWGDVEGAGDNQWNWGYYDTIFGKIRNAGLDVVPIMSFHQCGGNVGDDYTSYVPSWIWHAFEGQGVIATDMQYKSETGAHSGEYVSLWADDLVMNQYIEFMNAFEDRYAYMASDIDELNISGGPAGELRYPSYNSHDWGGYPNRGTLQAYSTRAVEDFRNDMIAKYGSVSGVSNAWGISLGSRNDINPPGNAQSFFNNYDYVNTQYGRDFIDWYNGSLKEHGDRMINAAAQAFDGSMSNIKLGMKIPGIHWHIAHPSYPRLSEITAGLIRTSVDFQNSSTGHGYNHLLSAFSGASRDVNLHFTCLEMSNKGNDGYSYSMAQDLVFWVANAAEANGIKVKGENALAGEIGNHAGWNNINNAFQWASYSGLTVLRIMQVTDDNSVGKNRFAQLIRDYPTGPDEPVTWPSLYARGTFNSWGTQAMTKSGNEWTTTATFAAGGRFKLDVKGDWTENYGDDGANGSLEAFGDDIFVPSAGTFEIKVNEQAKTYTLTLQGTPPPPPPPGDDLVIHYTEFQSAQTYYVHTWDGLTGPDIAMSYEGNFGGIHWWTVTIEDAPASFKFCFTNSNGNWDGVNRQYSNQADEIYVENGSATIHTSRP